jgi:argininosuccinate lyase
VPRPPPKGYPTAQGAPELIASGFAYESAGAVMLHDGINLADMAHVLDLLGRGIVPVDAATALLGVIGAADAIEPELFGYDPVDGEPYNSRERVFVEQVGDAAGWLHAGRPRREATRVAFRVYLRRRVTELVIATAGLVRALAQQASEHRATLFADQTYLQQAQPSTLGHYFVSHCYPLLRDGQRLLDIVAWLNQSPAGAGCVNGTRLAGERSSMAERLGFDGIIVNTRDAMWQVDGLVQLVSTLASLACTQTSLAEDLEIWASSEFDYVDLAEGYSRASVLMPQKRNPYALSIIRGTTGLVLGHVAGFLAIQKSPSARSDTLIFAYGEVPAAVEHTRRITELSRGVVTTLRVNDERLGQELANGYSQATDLAEQVMLSCGLDYRSAYRIVGTAVRDLSAAGRPASAMTVDDIDSASRQVIGRSLGMDPAGLSVALDPVAIVATRLAPGGAAPAPMAAMIDEVIAGADDLERAAFGRLQQFDAAEERLRRQAGQVAHTDASDRRGGDR